ncbi:RNA polymerase sigma factor [Cytobacillus oceanisediminis]|uniref:RNA polymerase sigma factor n=1 Tax=Cytobacillus oceanisediminis TaxID=665099 RepID=UPI002041745C|nr:sigma-70 family RNA polymerase sigma factor [Cytobacillus oceanisediminis]MCM3406026.1 sigma-70 family RNA polymerase sigma factor [Cytobacillus oceanisediminis]
MSEIKDAELYRSILQKDSKALELLYDRYEKLLFSFVYKMTHDPQLSEEVIQEVFMKLWKKHSNYSEDKGKFSSWLLTLTRNTALDVLRKQKPQESFEYKEYDSVNIDSNSPEEIVEWKERGKLIKRAVTKLKGEQQKMIDLFYFKGLSHQKISERTELPLGTVKGRLRLALKHLKTHIEKEGGERSND